MNSKMIAILAVAVVVVAGAGAAIALSGDDSSEEKGLYALHAKILNIDMGGMSGTPKMIDTIEYMYTSVYGNLESGADALTIADAKADTVFWNTYCAYDKLAVKNDDGTITYKTIVDSNTKTTVSKTMTSSATKLIATGSAYAYSQYYYICAKYSVQPFSAEAKSNTALVAEFQALNYAGLDLDSIKTSSEELASYYGENYKSRAGSLKTYDKEQLGQDITSAYNDGTEVVILMGSGTLDKDNNASYVSIAESNHGYILLNNASTVSQTLAMVDEIGVILGYSEYIDNVIENLELRLYKVYWSMQKKTGDSQKAYFEGSSGKASKSTGSGKSLCDFFGWDTSLFDGAEHDTESLLRDKPTVMMYYTNDTRSLDEKMRVDS